jgi:hypothetical protein
MTKSVSDQGSPETTDNSRGAFWKGLVIFIIVLLVCGAIVTGVVLNGKACSPSATPVNDVKRAAVPRVRDHVHTDEEQSIVREDVGHASSLSRKRERLPDEEVMVADVSEAIPSYEASCEGPAENEALLSLQGVATFSSRVDAACYPYAGTNNRVTVLAAVLAEQALYAVSWDPSNRADNATVDFVCPLAFDTDDKASVQIVSSWPWVVVVTNTDSGTSVVTCHADSGSFAGGPVSNSKVRVTGVISLRDGYASDDQSGMAMFIHDMHARCASLWKWSGARNGPIEEVARAFSVTSLHVSNTADFSMQVVDSEQPLSWSLKPGPGIPLGSMLIPPGQF